jgi:hypothetical protein
MWNRLNTADRLLAWRGTTITIIVKKGKTEGNERERREKQNPE